MGGALDQFDTVIVGAGSDNYVWIHIPVGYFYTFDNPRTDWRFRTEPDAG